MDDDLSSLRGSSTPPDDDFLSSFGASPSDAKAGGAPAGGSGSLDLFDSPAPAPAPAKKAKAPAKKKKRAAKRRSGNFMGMDPMQRMVLSVFLVLDVSVLGCLILVALGKINLTQ